jgi:hypothetical protein
LRDIANGIKLFEQPGQLVVNHLKHDRFCKLNKLVVAVRLTVASLRDVANQIKLFEQSGKLMAIAVKCDRSCQ